MNYLRVVLVIVLLFTLTCVLCWTVTVLLPMSPFFSIPFFLLGTLGVVVAVDALQSRLD